MSIRRKNPCLKHILLQSFARTIGIVVELDEAIVEAAESHILFFGDIHVAVQVEGLRRRQMRSEIAAASFHLVPRDKICAERS